MNQFTEEHIFNYLDQQLSPKETAEFELELKNNKELKRVVEKLRIVHLCFLDNKVESSSEKLSNQIMAKVADLSNKKYYQPSGLFSSTSFLLVSGILTALVAFLSMVNVGYFDIQTLGEGLAENGIFNNMEFLKGLDTKRFISNTMMVIYGVLALALLDRLVLNPFFRRKFKQLGLN